MQWLGGILQNASNAPVKHIIEDLSVNYTVERQVLLAGYSVQRIVRDYGIDLFVATYDASGVLENGDIRIQIKATDSLKLTRYKQAVSGSD